MKEVLQLVKKLTASELEKLIKKLSEVHDKKLELESEKSRLEAEAAQALEEARRKILEITLASGVTLEQLGYVQMDTQPAAPAPKRRNKRNLENQVFVINDGKPVLVFTREAKRLLEEGKAKRYPELTGKTKTIAGEIFEAYLAQREHS